MLTNLKSEFKKALKIERQCKCLNYYCSTCGSFSIVARNVINELPLDFIVHEFMFIDKLNLSQLDFKGRNQYCYPSEINVSLYVFFLKHVFQRLPLRLRQQILVKWCSENSSWPDWLFDGISYYFLVSIPNKESWIPHLKIRAITSEPIAETFKLKYSNFK